MITINEEFDVEFSSEINDELSSFAVRIGDSIKHMAPLERFYALKQILEELDGRISMYTVMDMMKDQGIKSFSNIEEETKSAE